MGTTLQLYFALISEDHTDHSDLTKLESSLIKLHDDIKIECGKCFEYLEWTWITCQG